ncbi:conserved Plasmodium protein, unknown function [Plasmodium gallinaceum]|uniref:Uncharacterized protein n=1 Tax=Plasmodium gallinaceum TaxID=5849 RepID=A0A1J1GMG8_PLAGA|nr:conserved Plasmodium protein, unknown function [Plasmodium gallinaceum]CRG93640.1 conserved Plasmodium protein, unknown function [Plasmodium gallinaceum]
MNKNKSDINKENNEVLWESLYNDFNEITDTHKKHFNYIENSLYEFCKGVSSKNLIYELKNRKNELYVNNNKNYEEKQYLNEFLINKEINEKDDNNEILTNKSLKIDDDKNYNTMIKNETDFLKKDYLKNNYWEDDYLENNYEIDNLKNENYRNISFNNALNSNQIKNIDNFNKSSFLLYSISKKAECNFELDEKNKYKDNRIPNILNMHKYGGSYFNNDYKNSTNNLKMHEEILNKNDHNYPLKKNNYYCDNLKEVDINRNFLGINNFDINKPNTNNVNITNHKNFKIKSEENLSCNNYSYIRNIRNSNSLEKLDMLLKNKCKYLNRDEIDLEFSKINKDDIRKPFLNCANYKIDSVLSENFNKNKQNEKNAAESDKIDEINHNILINRSKRLIEISKKCLSGYSDLDNHNIINLCKKENDYSENDNYRDYNNNVEYQTYVSNKICKPDVNIYSNENEYICENENIDEYEYNYENEDDENIENREEYEESDESEDYNKSEDYDYKRENIVDDKKKDYKEKEIMKCKNNNENEYNEENDRQNSELYKIYNKKSVNEENSTSSDISFHCIEESDTKKKKNSENRENQTFNSSDDYNLNVLFENSDNLKSSNSIIKIDQKLMNDNTEEKREVKEKNEEGNNISLNEMENNTEDIKIKNKKLMNLKLQKKYSESIFSKNTCEKNVKNLDRIFKDDTFLENDFTNIDTNNIKKDSNSFELEYKNIYNDCNLKNKEIEKINKIEKKNDNAKLCKIINTEAHKKDDEFKKKSADLKDIKITNDQKNTLDNDIENLNYSNNIKRLFKEKYFLEDLCEKRKCLIQKSKIENTKLNVEIKSLLSFNNNLSYALKEKEAEIKILKKQKEELEMKLMKRVKNNYSFLDYSSTYDIYKNQKINSNGNMYTKNSNPSNNMNDNNSSLIQDYEKKIKELLAKLKMYETKNNDLQEQLKIFMNE